MLAASASLLAVAPAHAGDLATTAAALRDKALADSTAWDVVESLTTEIGPRPTGSPAAARARDWAVAKFKALGFENVKVEPFETRSWLRGQESAEVVAPYPQPLHILGLGGSAQTPKGGLEAEVALFKSLAELQAQPPGALTGKIVVVTEKMTRTMDGSGYGAINPLRTLGPIEASKRGAVAYLHRSLSTDDTRLPHTGAMRPWGDVKPIPAAALSTPDAELLEHLAARGQPVRIKLSMTSTVLEKAPAWNVSGEIRGSEAPDEVIIIGGHLDSWDPGTGAIDDGAGVAITTAAAKLIGELPKHPRRTIRVVMWGSEEQGGAGEAYAAAHKDELPKVVLVGESDEGAGRIWKVALPKGAAGAPQMKTFASVLPPLKAFVADDPSRFGGSDVFPMVMAGAPVVDMQQDASRYFDWHHSADDTLDKIDPGEMAQNVAAWASFLYIVADSDIDFRALSAEAK
ncbi:M20/M25/M40 family metallo-hydrolase [Phenylobacterium sp.]|uniref:M20/M25/M40 family metallo-hydrolase n=1 Tax=Phenylobacterium sp. TaxID=1871053 RepID=UPI0035B2CFC4